MTTHENSILEWRLHAVMADRGIKFAKDLQDVLAKDGCSISSSSISRLVYKAPKQIDLRLLGCLCRALDCAPGDLLTPHQEKRSGVIASTAKASRRKR